MSAASVLAPLGHPEYNGLYGGIGAHCSYLAGELVAHDAAAFTGDFAFGVDNRNLLVGRALLKLFDVFFHVDRLHLGGIVGAEEFGKIDLHLIAVFQAVHKAGVEPGLGGAESKAVRKGTHFLRLHATGCRHFIGKRAPDGTEEFFVLLTVLGADIVTDIHFSGALELAVTDKLDVDIKGVQQILKEELGASQTVERAFALGIHEEPVGHGSEVVFVPMRIKRRPSI